MDTAITKALNETAWTKKYNMFYRVGDDDIISYDYMYELMSSTFGNILLDDGCTGSDISDCDKFYHQMIKRGMFDAVGIYVNDIEFLLNQIYEVRE